jgi:hypothetical protein
LAESKSSSIFPAGWLWGIIRHQYYCDSLREKLFAVDSILSQLGISLWPFLNQSACIGFAVVFNINEEDLLLIECCDNDILQQTRNELTILGKVDQLRLCC